MKTLLLATTMILALLGSVKAFPAELGGNDHIGRPEIEAYNYGPSGAYCTTNAYDGFVNVRTLPVNGRILVQLSNGVPVVIMDSYFELDGVTEWLWVSAYDNTVQGWSRRSSLAC